MPDFSISWVILTLGDRPLELRAAVSSLLRQTVASEIVVVVNGGSVDTACRNQIDAAAAPTFHQVEWISMDSNVGVPAGRHQGLVATSADIVGFLDDDAELLDDDIASAVIATFAREPQVGALAMRIVDESGSTSRRHVPRPGEDAERSGPVTNFLGGASVLRRSAYVTAGGYWGRLWYAHEELDLSWRMIEHGNEIRYDAALLVRHPATPISRHAAGWRLTGRNRVLVARRNLPIPLSLAHVTTWLFLGLARSPGRSCKRAYLGGWVEGWRDKVERSPMSWRTVVRLSRLGRPPLV